MRRIASVWCLQDILTWSATIIVLCWLYRPRRFTANVLTAPDDGVDGLGDGARGTSTSGSTPPPTGAQPSVPGPDDAPTPPPAEPSWAFIAYYLFRATTAALGQFIVDYPWITQGRDYIKEDPTITIGGYNAQIAIINSNLRPVTPAAPHQPLPPHTPEELEARDNGLRAEVNAQMAEAHRL